MSVYNFPVPNAPDYKKPTSVEDCLIQARLAYSDLATLLVLYYFGAEAISKSNRCLDRVS